MSENGKKLTLSRDTLLPLGAALAIMGTLLWASWQAATRLSEIQRAIGERPTRDEVRTLFGSNQWTTETMDTWVKLFRAQEPTLKIPKAK